MVKRGLNKKGQLTLFIILGILIVAGIFALFLILPSPEIFTSSSKDPVQEIRPCIAKSLEQVLPEFLEKGLYFDLNNHLTYNGTEINYHCFTDQKRTICTRNNAQSKSRIEQELKNKIENDVETCFNNFVVASRSLDVELQETDLSIEVLPGKINIKTRKDVIISRDQEDPVIYRNFDISINSPLWDYIRISNEIINQEVSCNCPIDACRADVTGLMNLNRDYKITLYMGGRDDRVYTIDDYYEQNKFMFAVKNCDKSP